jgi:hypothetical protein
MLYRFASGKIISIILRYGSLSSKNVKLCSDSMSRYETSEAVGVASSSYGTRYGVLREVYCASSMYLAIQTSISSVGTPSLPTNSALDAKKP